MTTTSPENTKRNGKDTNAKRNVEMEPKPFKRPAKAPDSRKPASSRSSFTVPFTLDSYHAQKAYDKGFVRACQALFKISVIYPEMLHRSDELEKMDQLNDHIAARIDWWRDEIIAASERIAVAIEDTNLPPEIAEFADAAIHVETPRIVEVEISSPLIIRLLNMFRALDIVFKTIHKGWAITALDAKHSRLARDTYRTGTQTVISEIILMDKYLAKNMDEIRHRKGKVDVEKLVQLKKTSVTWLQRRSWEAFSPLTPIEAFFLCYLIAHCRTATKGISPLPKNREAG